MQRQEGMRLNKIAYPYFHFGIKYLLTLHTTCDIIMLENSYEIPKRRIEREQK